MKDETTDQGSLLKTKFFLPALPSDFVSRPRLYGRLQEGFRTKLTLVSAPPGFGKTMLLGDWIRQKSIPAAWLSLDARDSDPSTFLSYVVRSVRNLEPGAGQAALAMLQSAHPVVPETILTGLLNDLQDIGRDMSLVLDDYHLIDSTAVQGLVSFALHHLPPRLHLILSTRSDPPFPLARLRSRNEMVEIRAGDLCFSEEEARWYFGRIPRLNLSGEDVRELVARSEGWVAGLKMIALSLSEAKNAGEFVRAALRDNRYIGDYLVEEALNLQPQAVQDFLLRTSILARMCGPLCDAVTGRNDGQALLDRLDKANLFVFSVDAEKQWYRYHQLFADLLRHRLRTLQAGLVPELHKRAGEWYARSGLTGEAIEHALEAGEYQTAAEMIETFAGSLWDRGLQFRLLEWLGRLPEAILLSWPGLALFKVRAQIMSGRYREAENLLESAGARLTKEGGKSPEIEAGWQGRLDTLKGFLAMYRGDNDLVHFHSVRALETLSAGDLGWRCVAAGTLSQAHSWAGDGQLEESRKAFLEAARLSREIGNPYFELFVRNGLAMIELNQGRALGALKMSEDLAAYAESKNMGQTGLASSVYALLGTLYYETDRTDQGLNLLRRSMDIASQSRDPVALAGNGLMLHSVLADLGSDADAEVLLSELETSSSERPLPPWIRHSIAAARGAAWLRSGDFESVERWARERGLEAKAKPHQRLEREYLVLARMFLGRGKPEEAAPLLMRWIRAAESGHRTLSAMSFRLALARALLDEGDERKAREETGRVLARAEQGGFFRYFVNRDPEIPLLLERVLAEYEEGEEGFSREYVRRILAAVTCGQPARPPVIMDVPLSAREVEVLKLLGAGLSNQEISDRLFISLNTVRTHTKNIHLKLGAHSRTQALARARERKIL